MHEFHGISLSGVAVGLAAFVVRGDATAVAYTGRLKTIDYHAKTNTPFSLSCMNHDGLFLVCRQGRALSFQRSARVIDHLIANVCTLVSIDRGWRRKESHRSNRLAKI